LHKKKTQDKQEVNKILNIKKNETFIIFISSSLAVSKFSKVAERQAGTPFAVRTAKSGESNDAVVSKEHFAILCYASYGYGNI
jgi:hypothetical protein